MIRLSRSLVSIVLLLPLGAPHAAEVHVSPGGDGEPAGAPDALRWSPLPDLPDALGVAGPFVGVHDGVLIIAGGANFPAPDGVDRWSVPKAWHAHMWALVPAGDGTSAWRSQAPLDRTIGYGASVSTPAGIVCIGGDDGTRVFDTVTLLTWNPATRRVECTALPSLPTPMTAGAAAAIGNIVYVACGQAKLGLDSAGSGFLRLDLSADPAGQPLSSKRWERLPDVPGGPRAFPIAVAQHNGFDECVYVMTGRRSGDGGGEIECLTDVHEFNPRSSDGKNPWRRRADMPQAAMAGTAVAVGQSHVHVLSGDDGSRWRETDRLRDAHPGFPARSLAYDTTTDTWTDAGPTPANQLATPAVRLGDGFCLVSGEIRPRHRTPAAWRIEPRTTDAGDGK